MSSRSLRSKRTSGRTRSQSAIASLQPDPPSRGVLSQQTIRVLQPSPMLPRRNTQPSRVNVQRGGVIPINFSPSHDENVNCPLCPNIVSNDEQGLCCDQCSTWYHAPCLLISDAEYQQLGSSNENWYCDHC